MSIAILDSPSRLVNILTLSDEECPDDAQKMVAMLMSKCVLTHSPPSMEREIHDEIRRSRPLMRLWGESMRDAGFTFNAEEQFRLKTRATRHLFVTSAIFMPSKLKAGDTLNTSSKEPGTGTIITHLGYRFAFIAMRLEFQDVDGKNFLITPAAYIIDHCVFKAMERYGGPRMRDALLRAFQTTAMLADHDYAHGTVIIAGSLPDRSEATASNYRGMPIKHPDLELHALRTHADSYARRMQEVPAIRARVMQQALRFADLLAEWEDHMEAGGVTQTERKQMTSYMAYHYLARLNCLLDIDDPRVSDVPIGESNRSIAQAYARFGPEVTQLTAKEVYGIMAEDGEVPKGKTKPSFAESVKWWFERSDAAKHPTTVLFNKLLRPHDLERFAEGIHFTGFDALRMDMMRTRDFRIQAQTHLSTRVSLTDKSTASVNRVTDQYRKAFAPIASELGMSWLSYWAAHQPPENRLARLINGLRTDSKTRQK